MKLPKRRETVLKKLYDMAAIVTKSNDHSIYRNMWELCSSWNSAHYKTNEEIFMFEGEDADGFFFMIEDDVFRCKEV